MKRVMIIVSTIFLFAVSVDGGYGAWKNVGSCSQTCGEGLQEQTRSCDNPKPQHGGYQCQGDSSQQISCNMGPCPSKTNHLHISERRIYIDFLCFKISFI